MNTEFMDLWRQQAESNAMLMLGGQAAGRTKTRRLWSNWKGTDDETINSGSDAAGLFRQRFRRRADRQTSAPRHLRPQRGWEQTDRGSAEDSQSREQECPPAIRSQLVRLVSQAPRAVQGQRGHRQEPP